MSDQSPPLHPDVKATLTKVDDHLGLVSSYIDRSEQHMAEDREETRWKHRVIRFVAFLSVINFVVAVGLAAQVQTRNSLIAKVDDQQAALNESVSELQHFVDDIEEVTPEEQAQADATRKVITEDVPRIIAILCAQTPDVPECAGVVPPSGE